MTDTEMERRKAICEVAGVEEIDDLSDGFHTFRQLYYQRMMLFATIVKQNKDKAWKSLRHEDGELCFGGGWFIVGIDTPEGSYTYHYEDNYYSLFDCEELECAKHWDGHTEKDVTRLLSLPSAQPDRDALEMAYAHGETAAEARYYEMLPKWLPVTKDTLPIKGKVVIVKGKTGTWDFGTYRGYSHVMGEGDIHKWNWKKNTLKSVYWWMYKDGALPEPTGGEQE